MNLNSLLSQLYDRIKYPQKPNLKGDREIEYSFVSAHLPQGPGKALDFGSATSHLGLVCALKGINTLSIDLLDRNFNFLHDNHNFKKVDILKMKLRHNYYDVVVNCSSIEHVGLVGRYGIKESSKKGDIAAMKRLKKSLKRSGMMILTIPVGQDEIFYARHRVYGKKRLPKLVKGFKVNHEQFWTKNHDNQWVTTSKKKALELNANEYFYNLGCFVLQKK